MCACLFCRVGIENQDFGFEHIKIKIPIKQSRLNICSSIVKNVSLIFKNE